MKNNDTRSRILSFLFHIFFVYILYIASAPKKFKQNEEKFEIIDADIVGVINQSKTKDVKIEEKILKKEIAPDVAKIEENKTDTKKTEIQKEEVRKEEKIVEKKKEEDSISQEKIIDKVEEKEDEIKKDIEKKDEIPKNEAKKIEEILKKMENNDEVNQLKKMAEKASKALQEIDEKKNIINKNSQSKDVIGGGDVATAKLGSYIKSQLIACWKIPPLIGIEIEKIFVIIQIKLDKDGNVLNSKILNKGQYGRSEFFDIISESALQAVNSCSPIKNLPNDKYDDWREVQLTFDPSKFIN